MTSRNTKLGRQQSQNNWRRHEEKAGQNNSPKPSYHGIDLFAHNHRRGSTMMALHNKSLQSDAAKPRR
jgi:hypothetical protein